MDGHFVPNLTFGPPVIKALARSATVPLDAHLMVTDPDPMIPELEAAGVQRTAVHVETCTHLHRTLATVREAGMEPGVAINPATSLAVIQEVLTEVEFVLVMSVNPGFGGQAFIPSTLDKIRRLCAMAGDQNLDISVDGGVDPDTAGPLVAAGATTLIAGSAVFGTDDRRRALDALRESARQGNET
jgi:ribulose-phosphate 3-epimerase